MRRSLLASVTLVPLLALTACGGDTDEAETPAPSPSASASPGESEAPEASADTIPVGETLTDPELGNSVEVIEYVPNFTVSDELKSQYAAFEDSQVVLVKVTMTAGEKYYQKFTDGELALTQTSDDIDIPPASPLPELAAEVEAAGYSPIIEPVDEGESKTGWTVFNVRSEEPTLTLSLKRLAYTVSGSDEVIPETTFDVVLPAS